MASPRPFTHAVGPSSIRFGPGLHFADALALVDDFLQRRPPPQVQGDQAAGQFRHAVLQAAGLAERAEHLEGLAVLVQPHGDVEAAEFR